MNLQTYIQAAGGLVEKIIYVFIFAALLVFTYGLVKFIAKAGDEGEVKKGRGIMTWGLLAMFVMFSVWGIIEFIGSELGIGGSQSIPLRK